MYESLIGSHRTDSIVSQVSRLFGVGKIGITTTNTYVVVASAYPLVSTTRSTDFIIFKVNDD